MLLRLLLVALRVVMGLDPGWICAGELMLVGEDVLRLRRLQHGDGIVGVRCADGGVLILQII